MIEWGKKLVSDRRLEIVNFLGSRIESCFPLKPLKNEDLNSKEEVRRQK
jgi:hypothetical protein